MDLRADDWPEFRGKGRLGVWHETGLLEEFPADGLEALWRTPIKAGFAGPAVADGRVFVTDFEATHGMRGTERALALDEAWPGNRRELRYVSWVHPAYANKHVYIRNDEEMISVSLNQADYQ